MKNIIIGIVIVAAAAGLYYWNSNRGSQAPDAQYARYQVVDSPLSFEYRESPNGYIVQELVPTQPIENLVKVVAVILESDYQSLMSGEREGGEAPPAIVVQIFNNPGTTTPVEWIEANPQISIFPLIQSEIEDTTVAGRDAISYQADGLYPSRNIVFADGNLIYYINGAYLDRESALYQDFEPFLESLEIAE